jgi:transposase
MVVAVRRGGTLRSVAQEFGVSLHTVQRWVERALGQRLDRVDWSEELRGGRRETRATATEIEDLVLRLRRELRETSDLGEFGAAAIHREFLEREIASVPAVRTIGRILRRRGALDGRQRIRRAPPPKGWYLPAVANQHAELDSFDFVEGLFIRGQTEVEVLNAISLHGGLCGSWVRASWTAKASVDAILEHWREHGLPDYAQFDNDTRFQGPHQWPDTFGRVVRLCLQLGVTPVFAPPRETGFQAAIENYNGRWQAKVWARFEHGSLTEIADRSRRFVQAARQRGAPRQEAAPLRRAFPKRWQFDLTQPLRGTVIYLRRTTERGQIELLGHRYQIDSLWPHRLVRTEVDLSKQQIRCYRLRRREPTTQPLVFEAAYAPPRKAFRERQ